MSGMIELIILNASRGVISTQSVYTFPATTSGWTRITAVRATTSATAFVRVRIRFPNLGGTVYLDDLTLS
jgi:hypothetical protein